MKYFFTLSLLMTLLFISCKPTQSLVHISKNTVFKDSLRAQEKRFWYHKDMQRDSLPGISLDRLFTTVLDETKGKEIIIAMIDTQTDLNHEDLQGSYWFNEDEIPNNGIDDDQNGYIDDVNGWNFIGNSQGESLFDANIEYIRFIKKYQKLFKDKNTQQIPDSLLEKYKLYLKFEKKRNIKFKRKELAVSDMVFSLKSVDSAKQALKEYFPNNNYTIKKLEKIQSTDKKIKRSISVMIFILKYDYTNARLIQLRNRYQKYLDIYLNPNFDDRALVGDNVEDISDTNYGYHNVGMDLKQKIYHATYIAGTLAANRKDTLGIKGIYSRIKIMPLSVSPNGDEQDKDIALAIRYAVDNGAQIINMSSNKDSSIHPEWVRDALKYAEAHNVLYVKAAANDGNNIDINIAYPTDVDAQGNEVLNNYIAVGASTFHVDKRLKASFSNYGKENVDLFAPGEDIYTTSIDNDYRFKNGTSMATPMVAGVAAIIMAYYPKLTAPQIKEIILASGVSYDLNVAIKDANGKEKLVPFSSLSKSGKILNAYNALILAKNYKKWKKGKFKLE